MSDLNLNVVVSGESRVVVAKPYPFPKVPKAPADLRLKLNGEAVTLAGTGGGKYPTYIYLLVAGKSYYLPKGVTPDTDTEVKVVEAPKVEAAPEAPKVEAPAPEVKPARGKRSK